MDFKLAINTILQENYKTSLVYNEYMCIDNLKETNDNLRIITFIGMFTNKEGDAYATIKVVNNFSKINHTDKDTKELEEFYIKEASQKFHTEVLKYILFGKTCQNLMNIEGEIYTFISFDDAIDHCNKTDLLYKIDNTRY